MDALKGDLQKEPRGGIFVEPADYGLGRFRGGLAGIGFVLPIDGVPEPPLRFVRSSAHCSQFRTRFGVVHLGGEYPRTVNASTGKVMDVANRGTRPAPAYAGGAVSAPTVGREQLVPTTV
ncbi:hypothetical protein [Streptomyces sp. HUAS ZL42]|uniref:hypothetical protein n=1 Tax=Streptomyces sp. HUAS ZL42 TaxID=3231715 RepID=UPI00345E3BE5